MKKLFKVRASYLNYCHIEVLADDSEQAIDLARDIDGESFTPDTNLFDGEWTIENATPIDKTIEISGSYGDFKVSATTGKILHRNHSDEYDMIKKFNMPETLTNVGDTLEDIGENYGLDIVLCGYTCYDGTIEPPMPPEEKLAIRERAICGINYDKNKNNYNGMAFVKAHCMTSDDDVHMDTFHMPDSNLYIQIIDSKVTAFNSDEFNEVGSAYFKKPLRFSNNVAFNFIKELRSENTGGGCMVDVLVLEDGHYIAITDECICLYPPVKPVEGLDIACNEDYLTEPMSAIELV